MMILLEVNLGIVVFWTAVDIRGDVSLTRANSAISPKVEGDVQTKDLIKTGDKSRAKLLLTDDTLLSVGQRSRLEVTEYLLDKNKRSSIVSLKAGALHTKVENLLNLALSLKFIRPLPLLVQGGQSG